jgi:hypothetical protein
MIGCGHREIKTVKDILESYLAEHGYDGLYNIEAECGCISGDLAPCDSMHLDDCCPGYKVKAHPEETDSGFDWLIGPRQPRADSDDDGEPD